MSRAPGASRQVRGLLIAAAVCYLASLAAPAWILVGASTISGLQLLIEGAMRADRVVLVHLLELVAAIWVVTGRRRNALIALSMIGAYAVIDPVCIVLGGERAMPHVGYALWIASVACLIVAARRLPVPHERTGGPV